MNWFKMATINECKVLKEFVKHCVQFYNALQYFTIYIQLCTSKRFEEKVLKINT